MTLVGMVTSAVSILIVPFSSMVTGVVSANGLSEDLFGLLSEARSGFLEGCVSY
jgi:hypothetical protein